jgi:HEAT repeat protein
MWRSTTMVSRPVALRVASLLALGALALPLNGCHGDDVPSRVADTPLAPTPAATDTAALHPAAEPRIGAGGAAAAAQEPLVPQRTRAGTLRFTSPAIDGNAALTPEILARLASEPSRELRLALIDALPRTGGDWVDGALALLEREPEPEVRKALVAILPRAEPTRALRGILAGLGDAAAMVRAEAALSAASLPRPTRDDAGLAARLGQLLSDDDARTRASAVRALGIMGRAAAFDPVARLLDDADSEVRLQAIHALERLDRGRARGLARLETLRSDGDPKVARAAARLVGR